MTNVISTARRFLVSAVAIGAATLGLAGTASASPAVTATASLRFGARVGHVDVRDHRTPARDGRMRIQPYPNPVILDPYHRAMIRYDADHDGRIDASERKGFWTYMVSTGAYGQLSSDESARFVQLVARFDLNADGRLLGPERVGMDRLIDSLRLFRELDWNGDRMLSAYEVGFSMFAPRFYTIDTNRDRRVSQQEVRDDALRAFRDGECG